MDQSNVTSTSDLLLESQLSIVSFSKKDMHGQLYREVMVCVKKKTVHLTVHEMKFCEHIHTHF